MRYDDRPTNGHHHPNWDLFGILLGIQGAVSRVEASLERTHEQMTAGLDRANERIDVVHDRIDTHLAAPRSEKVGWVQLSGMSIKEIVVLLLMAVMGAMGTLGPEHVVALMGR